MKTALLILCSALLVGCSTTTSTEYYLLAPSGPAPSGSGIGIGVGPVTVAEYLDRSNLIFQSSAQKLEIAEDQQWAGDMRKSIASVTATNLGRAFGTGNIRTYPWEHDDELRYQVSLDVRQFHGTSDGHALLEASWRVYQLPGGKLLTSRSDSFREKLYGDGFEELAAAQSRALNQLAYAIKASIH